MKYAQHLLFAIAALFLVSCNTPEPAQRIPNAKVDFTYTTDGLTVHFTNKSTSGLAAYSWEFGDGALSGVNEEPSHKYAKEGVYKVTLVCRDAHDYTYTASKDITVTNGTTPPATTQNAYIKGFKLYATEFPNYYYRFECVAHDLYGNVSLSASTEYSSSKITTANLPYTQLLSSPVLVGEMPDPFDYYKDFTIMAYYAGSTNANGAQVMNVTVSGSAISGKTEYIARADNGTKVGLLIEYK